MTQVLKFTAPIPPSVNSYIGHRIVFIGNKPVPKQFLKEDTKQYKEYMHNLLKREMKAQNWITPEKNSYIVIETIYYFQKHGMDQHNYVKVPFDVFQEAGIYKNDSKAIEKCVNVFIDRKNPRVEYKIYISNKIGVFNDTIHLNSFILNCCRDCKRFKRNCRLLKDAKNNIIQHELDTVNLTCNCRQE